MKKDFRSRFLVGCLGFILFSIATFVNYESTLFFLVAVWTFSFLELTTMIQISDLTKDIYFSLSVLIFIGCFFFLQYGNNLITSIIGLLWLTSVILIWITQKNQNRNFSFLYMLYLTIPFAFLVSLRKTTDAPHFFLLLVIIWALDVFSYSFGICLGKHSIAPRISPKKTWEGTIFGILFSFAFGVFGFLYLKHTTNFILITIGCIFVPIFGFLGDLFESSIKRAANKKDSGTILLGHGGFLDRFDSLLFAAVIFGILIQFL